MCRCLMPPLVQQLSVDNIGVRIQSSHEIADGRLFNHAVLGRQLFLVGKNKADAKRVLTDLTRVLRDRGNKIGRQAASSSSLVEQAYLPETCSSTLMASSLPCPL